MTELNGIAIVGMATRVPGAGDIATLWANLTGGVESVSFFTAEELADAGVPTRVTSHPGYVPASAVLRQTDMFDAAFFGLTPREAALLDPQGRLLMECVWEAIEDAGHVPATFSGLVGVFGGVGASRYFMRNLLPAGDRLDGAGAYQAMIANDKDFIPTWVSYKLNLKGPSVAVQTACSTSLVAVHLACQSLLSYQCDMAVAGGASLSLDEKSGYVYQEGGILSPDGHCRPFDAKARGTVYGSGAGVVALRRLEDAVADGDPIIAVIKGSAINNDGAVKVGFTAPGVDGQADVIAMAHAVADVEPDTIGFVEAHGTGTPLGDPVEVMALTRVFRRQSSRRAYCALGSAKSNFGHLDAAAGVTGLIKAALAVHHGQIPPTVHFESANPQIDLDASPFYVNATAVPWPTAMTPRRAGVSSFGIGGTNAHAVIEAAPEPRVSGPARRWQFLALSAMTPAALEAATDRLADDIDAHPDRSLADVAYTLLVGRQAFAHRRIVLCQHTDSADDVIDALDARSASHVFTGETPEATRPVTLMFPGQGSQYVDMAAALYAEEPQFRAALDECAAILTSRVGIDVLAHIFPTPGTREAAIEQLGRTDICQLALFSVEYAVARLVMAVGVKVHSFIGHSVGEYVAACLAGVFTLEDALVAVAARGRLMAEMPHGAMLAVSAPEADVKTWIDPATLSVAVVNSPNACVIAGPTDAIAALAETLDSRGVLHRRLDVSHAFHSHMMDAALPRFREAMSGVTLHAPHTPFISNVTGTWIKSDEATDREYWVRQMRRTVYFSDGLREVLKDPNRVVIEAGPGRTLQVLALQQRTRGSQQDALALLPDARDSKSSAETFAAGIARLWMTGAEIDWTQYYADEQRNRVRLPTYPFQRERHWIEAPTSQPATDDGQRQPFAKWFHVPAWKQAPLSSAPALTATASWLIVGDLGDAAEPLAAALRERGQTVSTAALGQPVANAVDQVICFATTFESTLASVQSAALVANGRPLVVTFVQTGVQSVDGRETIVPENATVLGLWRVLPQEFKNLRTRHIDVAPAHTDADRSTLVHQLLTELATAPGVEAIAFRGRYRWQLEHAPVVLPTDTPSRFRLGGVYWITGGTGGIGLSLAEYLAATYQARLVLSSRSADALPESVRERIRQCEALGSEVITINADVCDLTQMQRATDQIASRFGQLHGVIHTAGVPGGRLIALEAAASADVVMRPKTRGAEILDEVVAGFPLDFVAYCSSLATELGGVGQAAYAAGNAALDARARWHESTTGRTTVSVNWDRWRDVGMAATLADRDAIGSSDGARALEAALTLHVPQVFVSTIQLRARRQATVEVSAQLGTTTRHPRPALSNDYVKPSTDAEVALAELWQDILGLTQVGVEDNFFELGGDSLTALRLTAVYHERTNVSVPVTTLYAAPTIRQFLRECLV